MGFLNKKGSPFMNDLLEYQVRLQNELRQFGLNPTDWTLMTFDSNCFLIQNILDRSFTLKGHLTLCKNFPQWKAIEIYSL
jgi:hypothetical protein